MLTIVAMLLAGVATLSAQQNLWQKDANVSPEINADNSVTIRLYAPNAERVTLVGDFVDNVAMTRNREGVWEYTSAPLAFNNGSKCFPIRPQPMTSTRIPSMEMHCSCNNFTAQWAVMAAFSFR
jgi:hypothetical protein